MSNRSLGILTAGLMLAGAPIFAHHSFAAEYDANAKITLKGTVTKVEWTNPHAWFYIDVKDDAGNVAHWQCEIGPPNELSRRGWRKDSLKPGDQITVNGFRAKDGTNTANAHEVLLPDGKKAFSGTADPATGQ